MSLPMPVANSTPRHSSSFGGQFGIRVFGSRPSILCVCSLIPSCTLTLLMLAYRLSLLLSNRGENAARAIPMLIHHANAAGTFASSTKVVPSSWKQARSDCPTELAASHLYSIGHGNGLKQLLSTGLAHNMKPLPTIKLSLLLSLLAGK